MVSAVSTKAEALVPIREISRLTGVNTVTLRAWERRYGLLIPQRTEKGHRLYSHGDIERVRRIQSWLMRGLSISKVRDLLFQPDMEIASESSVEDVWQAHRQQLSVCLQSFHRRKLEGLLAEWFALYPPEIIADQCLAPMLEQLLLPGYTNASRRAFLGQILGEFIYSAVYRQRQSLGGRPVLIIQWDTAEPDCQPLMLSYGLIVKGYPTELLKGVPPEEWLPLVEHWEAAALIVCADTAVRLTGLQEFLANMSQHFPCPLRVLGRASRLLAAQSLNPALLLGDRLQSAMDRVVSELSEGETPV